MALDIRIKSSSFFSHMVECDQDLIAACMTVSISSNRITNGFEKNTFQNSKSLYRLTNNLS